MTSALVIVAHPDDETIWIGGTIMRNQNWKWTIISMCRKNDLDRMPKFMKVCKFYNAEAIISDLDDEKLKPVEINDIAKKLHGLLPKEEYDYVFTHGENGEYGHIRHKEVNKAVKKLVEEGKLKCRALFFFSYLKGKEIPPANPETRIAIPNPNAEKTTILSKEILKKKKELVRDTYGHPEKGFEVMCCNKTEAFDKYENTGFVSISARTRRAEPAGTLFGKGT